MIVDDVSDPLLRAVSQLEALAPDQRRAARLRERCRAQMRRAPTPERRLGPVLFIGLCMVYLSALVLDVLWLGML